jgi:hypothetical protein
MFRYAVTGAQPLRIQLGGPSVISGPSSTSYMRVRELNATGEAATGTAYAPNLSIPATFGTGTQVFAVDGGVTATAPVVSTFTVLPTDPTDFTPLGVNVVPQFRIFFPEGSEALALPGSGLLFYANASGAMTWSGDIAWEEI